VDEAVCAIRPGTDMGRYARFLPRTYDALLSGDHLSMDPRRLVARSWQRVRAQGVDPDRREPPGPLDATQVELRRTTSPLQGVLPELRAALTAVAEDARHVMVVTDADGVLRLTLELDARPPRAVVAGTNVWVYPLSTRHAEVLLLLARAGRAGMDAAVLSRALYGHVGSLVTIRAEVSRLRKAAGGLVLARPYRLAPEVEVVLPDLARSPFVAVSTVPAVRALAGS
jgi:hypothetical protein